VLCARALCVNSYSRILWPVCAAGILMVVPSPYLLYDNLAIKMYARERRERPRIHHHRAARHKDAHGAGAARPTRAGVRRTISLARARPIPQRTQSDGRIRSVRM